MRALKVIGGLVLIVVGLLLTVTPGPGVPVFVLGLGLVLSQSAPGRRTLSRIRLWARGRFGSEHVRRVEGRLPKDVVGPHDTIQMRLDLDAYRRAREEERRRRRPG